MKAEAEVALQFTGRQSTMKLMFEEAFILRIKTLIALKSVVKSLETVCTTCLHCHCEKIPSREKKANPKQSKSSKSNAPVRASKNARTPSGNANANPQTEPLSIIERKRTVLPNSITVTPCRFENQDSLLIESPERDSKGRDRYGVSFLS